MVLKMVLKPKFIYNPNCAGFSAIGAALEKKFSDTPIPADLANIIIPVGGDGSLYFSLPRYPNKTHYGIVPANSNSAGFHMNHYAALTSDEISDEMRDQIIVDIETAVVTPVHALQATITYQDGTQTELKAFSDIIVEHDSAQASLLRLTGTFNAQAYACDRLMGNGLIFSSFIGSTGANKSAGGPVMTSSDNVIIVTGILNYDPADFQPVVARDTDIFHVEFLSQERRPVRIDYDSNTLRPPAHNSFKCMDIRMNEKPYAYLAKKRGPQPC